MYYLCLKDSQCNIVFKQHRLIKGICSWLPTFCKQAASPIHQAKMAASYVFL